MGAAGFVELREYLMLAAVGGVAGLLAVLVSVVSRLVAARLRAVEPEPDETPTAPFWRPRLPHRVR